MRLHRANWIYLEETETVVPETGNQILYESTYFIQLA